MPVRRIHPGKYPQRQIRNLYCGHHQTRQLVLIHRRSRIHRQRLLGAIPANRVAFRLPDPRVHGLLVQNGDTFETLPIDVIFPVLHGKNGEDGTIQGLFQLSGIPYVGRRMLASAVCMDKVFTNLLLDSFAVPQARFLWFYAIDYQSKKEAVRQEIADRLGGYPVFVKPANAGSSVGVSKVHNESELDAAVAVAAKEDGKILIEEFIDGQEVECAVLGNETPQASLVGEILGFRRLL